MVLAVAQAQNPFDISYPIPELGNCGSQEECKNFCDNPDNHAICIEWGQKQGVFSAVEAKRMKDIEQMENKPEDPVDGPGGCRSPRECDAYCRILENLNECLDYGVANGYNSAEEAQKIREQAQRGGPGGCNSREQCDAYCKNPANIELCMKFVVEEGKITQDEADLIIEMTKKGPEMGKPKGPKIDEQKTLQVLEEKGGGPGGCKNPDECRAYCEDFNHGEECINFAVENNFIPPQEAEMAKKMMSIGGPGGCKGPQECDAFCGKEENRDTCFNFSKENGLFSPEEAIMMEKQMFIIRKLDDKAGPGGCRSAQECSVYCNDPSKIQECMDFASETGMMSKEKVQTMMQQMQKTEMMQEFFMGGTMMGPPPGMEGSSGEGMMPPPNGYMGPPPGYEGQMPPEGEFMPPPTGELVPPPPPPPSSWNTKSIMGVILGPFLDILR